MTQSTSTIDDFGMDTITLAGSLENKLAAMRAAGFRQVMLKANDLVGHAGGVDAAVRAVRASGLRVPGFQVLRDFEGLCGPPACLQGRHRPIHAGNVRGLWRLSVAGVLIDLGSCRPRHRPSCGRFAQAGHVGRSLGHQGGLRRFVLGSHRQRVHHRLGCGVPCRFAQPEALALIPFTSLQPRLHLMHLNAYTLTAFICAVCSIS